MLGEKIKNLRQDSKLSQAQFAERIKISVSALYSYETERQTPSADVIKKICEEFKVSADWLLDLNLSQGETTMSVATLFEFFRKLPEEAGFIKAMTYDAYDEVNDSEIEFPVFAYISGDKNFVKLVQDYIEVKKLSDKVSGVVDVVSPWLSDSLTKYTMKTDRNFENKILAFKFMDILNNLDFKIDNLDDLDMAKKLYEKYW